MSQVLKAYSVSFSILAITPDTKGGAAIPVYVKEWIGKYLRTSELSSIETFSTVALKTQTN